MSEDHEAIKKISPDQVEVVGVASEGHPGQSTFSQSPFQMKVIKGGPVTLLLLPLLIPVFLIGFILLMIAMIFFGTSVFKMVGFKKGMK